MTWYITIRSDDRYSQSVDAESLKRFLAQMPELQAAGPHHFRAADGAPWDVQVIFGPCDAEGNYGWRDGVAITQANVVELLCPYASDAAWCESIAQRIAAFLGWQAFEDHEERRIWP